MAIKLNIVKPTSAIENAIARGYLYKDIRFDLTPSFLQGRELNSTRETTDLDPLFDKEAIINSLKNILSTTPGEKLLNPLFGLDLRDYLFETVSENKAFFLGNAIYTGILVQEPRISVDLVEVIADIDEMEYIINLELSIPELEIYKLTLKGVLSLDGYNFV
jgi:phage baseplate assembly protein W